MFDWFYKNKEKKLGNYPESYVQEEPVIRSQEEIASVKKSNFRFPLIPDDDFSYTEDTYDFTGVDHSNFAEPENKSLRSQRRHMKERLQPLDDWSNRPQNQNTRSTSSFTMSSNRYTSGNWDEERQRQQQRNFNKRSNLYKPGNSIDSNPAFLRKKNQTMQNHPFQNDLQYVDAYRKRSAEDLHIFESSEPKSQEPRKFFRPTPFVSPVHGRLDSPNLERKEKDINIESVQATQENVNVKKQLETKEHQLLQEDKVIPSNFIEDVPTLLQEQEMPVHSASSEVGATMCPVEEAIPDFEHEIFVEKEIEKIVESNFVQEPIFSAENHIQVDFETAEQVNNIEEPTTAHQLAYLVEENIADTSIQKDDFPQEEIKEPEVYHKERTTERTIPINVLMFNEDKYHLTRRKMEQEATLENLSEVVSVQDENPRLQVQAIPTEQADVHHEIAVCNYQFPSLDLLKPPVYDDEIQDYSLDEKVAILDQVLKDFNVGGKVVSMTKGPTVTRYEVQPDPGVKVNKIVNLADDLKLYLAAQDIRIEAPIPGKSMVGIEIPNDHPRPVYLREILAHRDFQNKASSTKVALGLNIEGLPVSTDIRKMPHGLIAGSTGSGKSVCINSILISLLYMAHPDDVRLMLIDPKMVELASYNALPHLVCPVITDAKAATKALKWAVDEMERRYELFSKIAVRDIDRYNELASRDPRGEKMPAIIIIIDELADLMMVAANEVESHICRIAQKARACGIHLILATQRPSVDVITGLIKANIPSRIAFSVSSQIDSRTILDSNGAERLLGKGDMLLSENGSSKLVRVQGTYVSDDEIEQVVTFVKKQMAPQYLFTAEEITVNASMEDEDELFPEILEFAIEAGTVSTSMIQRKFRIGYNRAARIIDVLEEKGYISGANGSKPREVLIDQL